MKAPVHAPQAAKPNAAGAMVSGLSAETAAPTPSVAPTPAPSKPAPAKVCASWASPAQANETASAVPSRVPKKIVVEAFSRNSRPGAISAPPTNPTALAPIIRPTPVWFCRPGDISASPPVTEARVALPARPSPALLPSSGMASPRSAARPIPPSTPAPTLPIHCRAGTRSE